MTKRKFGTCLVVGVLSLVALIEPALSQTQAATGSTSAATGPGIAAIEEGTCYVLAFATGSFGALLVAVASVGAVVAAALGDMRKATNAIVIAACAWLIEPTASFFFLNSDPRSGQSTQYGALNCNARGVELPRPGRG